MRLLFILFCVSLVLQAKSQNVLTGQVLDSVTREPIPFANVFFANTTRGAVSNEKGEFEIRNFQSGKYDLTVSFVGYKTRSKSLTFADQPVTVKISLLPEVVRLNEVVIRPNYKQKESDLRQFIGFFIGQNRNASECKVINEKDIVAYEDEDLHALIAYSFTPLEIKNEALGYRLFYELENFEVNYLNLTQDYSGIPRFEELTPKKQSQKRLWDAERKRAYEGSFIHLIHCLREGRMTSPFVLHEFFQVPNRKRPPEDFLKAKTKYWRDKFYDKSGTGGQEKMIMDSLKYYSTLYNLPVMTDSLGQLFTRPGQLLDATREHFTFSGLLHVVYTREAEEPEYVNLYRSNHGNEQHSIILFKNPGVAIYGNGYYEPLQDVFFDGYMMWSDRISNLLPREYIPGR